MTSASSRLPLVSIAELDLEIDQRAAFELPGLLEHEKRLAGDAPHLGKDFRFILAG